MDMMYGEEVKVTMEEIHITQADHQEQVDY